MRHVMRRVRRQLRALGSVLYYSITILSVMSVGLAVNFWTSTPTFNPYGIPKDLIGVIFGLLGVSHLIFLNALQGLRKLRLSLTTSGSFMTFWGISNTQQAFAGNASFQLPILLVAVALLHLPMVVKLIQLERL